MEKAVESVHNFLHKSPVERFFLSDMKAERNILAEYPVSSSEIRTVFRQNEIGA